MDVINELVKGIALENYRGYVLPKGLKQHESCLKCAYGGQDLTVNFCKRPQDQECLNWCITQQKKPPADAGGERLQGGKAGSD